MEFKKEWGWKVKITLSPKCTLYKYVCYDCAKTEKEAINILLHKDIYDL